MNVPQLDLVAQYHTIKPEIDAAVHGVLDSGQFILGPNVAALEEEIAAYLDVRHAVGVASGTDALVLALRALDIGPGDEVIVPTYTFYATAEAVMLVGATPVFVDMDPTTYCLVAEQVEARITGRTKAVIPVHLYGHPVDMDPILAIARRHSIKVIEDTAQAFGAEYKGRKVGGMGDIGAFSFFPSKNLGAYGDGGLVVTHDDGLAERLRMLRSHGWKRKYEPELVGYNSRLDELQAAILRVNLRHLDRWNDCRRDLVARYNARLAGLVGRGVTLPAEAEFARHVYHVYLIRVPERDHVQAALKDAGIGTAVYYPIPVHLLEPCRILGYHEGDFPIAEAACADNLALPIFPDMTAAQLEAVAVALEHALS